MQFRCCLHDTFAFKVFSPFELGHVAKSEDRDHCGFPADIGVDAPSVSVKVEVKDSEARSKRARDESGQMASSSSDVPPKGGENLAKSGDLQDGSAGKNMRKEKGDDWEVVSASSKEVSSPVPPEESPCQ